MSEIPQRQAYGEALAAYGARNEDVVVLDADVSTSTLSSYFGARFPDRFYNVGVTEASMVDVGVGFALGGKIPFVSTFGALLTLRACEQIRTCVAYARTNVKLIGGYAGVSDYKDGPTHFATNDVAIMRSMPGMTVIVPADNAEAAAMVERVAELDGPVYMRISRAVVPDVFSKDHKPNIGQGVVVRNGEDVALVATGTMVARCLAASDKLAGEGVHAAVVAMSTIKPLDTALLESVIRLCGALVTAEEHTVIGGLGSAVADFAASARPVPIEMVGLKDNFAETGPDPETLMDAWGLSVDDVVNAARRSVARKTPQQAR